MTIYNVRDYALPDAEPKRARPVVVGVVGVAAGLALGFGLGVGAGGALRKPFLTAPLSFNFGHHPQVTKDLVTKHLKQ